MPAVEIPGTVDSGTDGLLLKLIIQTQIGVDLDEQLVAIVGEDDVVSRISRAPTLEEAYLNIFQD